MADPSVLRAHALAEAGVGEKRPAEDDQAEKWRNLYHTLKRKCTEVEGANDRLARRIYKTKKVLEHVNRERSILMEKLDQYEDGYRDAAKNIQANAIVSITSVAGGHSIASPDAEAVIGFPSVRGAQGRLLVTEAGAPVSPSSMYGSGHKGSKGSTHQYMAHMQTPVGKKGNKKSPGSNGGASPQVMSAGKAGGASSEKKAKPDPNAPKKPSNAFFMYSQIQRAAIQEEYHASAVTGHHELTKLIAKKWNELPVEEKKVYYDMYEKDKERYATELRSYQQTGSVPSSATATSSSKKKQMMLMSVGGGSGASTPLLPHDISKPASVGSSVGGGLPMASLHSAAPMPALSPMFDDDLGNLGSGGAVLVDATSPLMDCPPPDVLASERLAFAGHHHLKVDAGNHRHRQDDGDDDDDCGDDSDAASDVQGMDGVADHAGVVGCPELAMDTHAAATGLSLSEPPSLTLEAALGDDNGVGNADLHGLYSLDDGGSSAGLDPQEAASIARSFEDDGEHDASDLQLEFGQTMIDN